MPIHRPVSFLASIVAQCLFPTVSESSNLGGMDGLAQGSVMREHSVGAQEESVEEQCQRVYPRSLLRPCFSLPLVHPAMTIHDLNDCSTTGGHSISFQKESCEEKAQRMCFT